MKDTDLKSSKYTISPSADSGNNQNSAACSNAKGTVLFKLSGNQFVGTDGKTLLQIQQGQQNFQIQDGSGKLLGSIAQQQAKAVLNDASNKAIASAAKDGSSNGFRITAPDGDDSIATVTIYADGQQQNQQNQNSGQGGAGIASMISKEFGAGGWQGNKNQQGAAKKITISVQSQTIDPLLLLAFASSLPKLLGQGQSGNQKRGGLGGMGMGILGGMLMGGLLGGMGSSGGGRRGGRLIR